MSASINLNTPVATLTVGQLFDVMRELELARVAAKAKYKVSEVSTLTGVSESKIRQMCEKHEILANKVGTHWILTQKDVEYIKNGFIKTRNRRKAA